HELSKKSRQISPRILEIAIADGQPDARNLGKGHQQANTATQAGAAGAAGQRSARRMAQRLVQLHWVAEAAALEQALGVSTAIIAKLAPGRLKAVGFGPDDMSGKLQAPLTQQGRRPRRACALVQVALARVIRAETDDDETTGAIGVRRPQHQYSTLDLFQIIAPHQSDYLVFDFTTTLVRKSSPKGFDASEYTEKQVFYTSKDGTRVPMFIVRHRDLEGPAPCLLYGYGGFNISIMPYFSTDRLPLLRNYRCAFAVANIRGGDEFGEDWHLGGCLMNKQNCFDDFIAAAEYLVKEGVALPDKLVIEGASNGGLLVAACALQRPDLYAGVVCSMGVLDMLRFHKFTIGHGWVSDYGTPDGSKSEFRNVFAYSPLHNVARVADRSDWGSDFPALLVLTASHDDRVMALHSLKFVAEVQYRLGSRPGQTRPLLARIETKDGHGFGRPLNKTIEERADVYCFMQRSLALPGPRVGEAGGGVGGGGRRGSSRARRRQRRLLLIWLLVLFQLLSHLYSGGGGGSSDDVSATAPLAIMLLDLGGIGGPSRCCTAWIRRCCRCRRRPSARDRNSASRSSSWLDTDGSRLLSLLDSAAEDSLPDLLAAPSAVSAAGAAFEASVATVAAACTLAPAVVDADDVVADVVEEAPDSSLTVLSAAPLAARLETLHATAGEAKFGAGAAGSSGRGETGEGGGDAAAAASIRSSSWTTAAALSCRPPSPLSSSKPFRQASVSPSTSEPPVLGVARALSSRLTERGRRIPAHQSSLSTFASKSPSSSDVIVPARCVRSSRSSRRWQPAAEGTARRRRAAAAVDVGLRAGQPLQRLQWRRRRCTLTVVVAEPVSVVTVGLAPSNPSPYSTRRSGSERARNDDVLQRRHAASTSASVSAMKSSAKSNGGGGSGGDEDRSGCCCCGFGGTGGGPVWRRCCNDGIVAAKSAAKRALSAQEIGIGGIEVGGEISGFCVGGSSGCSGSRVCEPRDPVDAAREPRPLRVAAAAMAAAAVADVIVVARRAPPGERLGKERELLER
uniref:Prolyl endopeptidase n=1 Tax=Macrostomum lignano TaxID=282301 RepID=A0A1I8IBP4_9PLAT